MHTSMQTEGVPLAPPAAGFGPGDVVGPWRIEGVLGRGGMSTVYGVVHAEIGKRAALKVVHGHVLTSTFTAERVLLEAQVVNRIGHDHIVDIFESGTLSDGRPYLVMERLDGVTLGQRFADARMPAPDVIAVLIQICDALAAAHAAGIVHRDLKLDNVFLVDGPAGPRSRAKVLDWGIAKVVTATPTNTFADKLIGTPQYVSPEQARGGEITPAADIYSLGVMAYELFLEGPPFVSQSAAELLVMHLRDEPPPPRDTWPDIPPALEALLLAMLAKTPSERPTAEDIARELAAIGATLGPQQLDAPPMLVPAVRVSTPVQVVAIAHDGERVKRTVPSTIVRHVRRPRLQRQRVLVGAIASVVLLAGVGTMEAMLRADDALGAESVAAEPATAPPTATPEPVATTKAKARAPAGDRSAPRVPSPSAAPPQTDPLMSDRKADPDPRPGARKHRARPTMTKTYSPRTLASASVPIDPDGTIEPYQ